MEATGFSETFVTISQQCGFKSQNTVIFEIYGPNTHTISKFGATDRTVTLKFILKKLYVRMRHVFPLLP
jgi:hypothetical protein